MHPAPETDQPERELAEVTVIINGTGTNRWHRYGLRCNPFPQIAKSEYYGADMAINSLDGDPIDGPGEIRRRLRGFAAEFVELCCANYRRGERVGFTVTFPL